MRSKEKSFLVELDAQRSGFGSERKCPDEFPDTPSLKINADELYRFPEIRLRIRCYCQGREEEKRGKPENQSSILPHGR